LRTNSIYHALFREGLQSKVIIPAITQSISVVWTQKSEWILNGDRHFAFRSRDINPAFASSLIERAAFPERNLAICVIKGVGTTRWFLLPISTFLISCHV
jgi:hypothetical protein